jgi:hypothetical protein
MGTFDRMERQQSEQNRALTWWTWIFGNLTQTFASKSETLKPVAGIHDEMVSILPPLSLQMAGNRHGFTASGLALETPPSPLFGQIWT